MTALQSLNVLLVDDNQHMRAIAAAVLYSANIRTVREASDGAAAFEILRQHPIDLAIVDFNMFPLDGVGFTRLVRNSAESPNVYLPIIMMTGHSEKKRVTEARDAGVTDFVVKPITAKAVLDRIEAGEASGKDLTDAVTSAEFAQNVRQFGSLCGRECKVLNGHHDIEEFALFPELASKGNDALRAVVDRLKEEHKVVHELLVRLERAAMALMFEVDAEKFSEARAVFRQLETVVHSHFGYEETQLEEAIGVFKVGV